MLMFLLVCMASLSGAGGSGGSDRRRGRSGCQRGTGSQAGSRETDPHTPSPFTSDDNEGSSQMGFDQEPGSGAGTGKGKRGMNQIRVGQRLNKHGGRVQIQKDAYLTKIVDTPGCIVEVVVQLRQNQEVIMCHKWKDVPQDAIERMLNRINVSVIEQIKFVILDK